MSTTKKSSTSRPASVRSADSGRFVEASANGWAIKGSAGGRAASVHSTREEAVRAAKQAISAKGGALVVRDGKGRVQSTLTIGRDPFTKISAVEGIAPTKAAKTRAREFTRSKLSSEQRLHAIIEAHRPRKG